MPEDQTGVSILAPDTTETVGTVGDIAQHNLDQAAKWMGDKATLERLAQSDDTWTSLHAKQQLRAIKDEELARESAATPEDVHAKLREDINRVAKGVAGELATTFPRGQGLPGVALVLRAEPTSEPFPD